MMFLRVRGDTEKIDILVCTMWKYLRLVTNKVRNLGILFLFKSRLDNVHNFHIICT